MGDFDEKGCMSLLLPISHLIWQAHICSQDASESLLTRKIRKFSGLEWMCYNKGGDVTMAKFPSLKAKRLFRVLGNSPLNYVVIHRVGSHRKLSSLRGYPEIMFAFHDKETVSGSLVRKILCEDVGLGEEEALDLI